MKKLLTPFESFVRSESFGGLLLMASALGAFVWANSPGAGVYESLKAAPLSVTLGGWALEKPLLLWVNDGLMALFFLLVGLEIKRELLVGELASARRASLPALAALGGMLVPAACYALLNAGGAGASGWGIPMATDIAFALGILSLLGDRVPIGLKVLLTAVAIVDDLGAVLVIAVFYTSTLSAGYLLAAGLTWAAAMAYGWRGGSRLVVFGLLGLVLWYFTLKSGVHATIAGVLLAWAVPLRHDLDIAHARQTALALLAEGPVEEEEAALERVEDVLAGVRSPLHELEHRLHPWAAYAIMPVFALFNAGFALSGAAALSDPVPLGIIAGLLLGKPIGIGASAWLAVRAGISELPAGVSWRSVLGLALLCGIGFTMSLFIASLAFTDPRLVDASKAGILAGSVMAALLGALTLRTSLAARTS